MKKFLALVLALVMTMSLVTIAGAEDFTDAADVTYTEAVDVMTAVGVVGGYADGSFNPTAGLTRGAAAKIICNMILGPTTAEALSADAAPYSDVAVDNVFAGYIAYCAKEGIISGYADGTFRPAAPLTGYAFMKMLLGALGYDAAIEGYTGANWSINVAKQALAIDLDAGLVDSFKGTKALTREEACLYAFNTLNAQMVRYPNNTSIVVGDVTVTTSGNPVNDGLFMDKYFEDLTDAPTTDDFGRPATKWYTSSKMTKASYVGTYADAADYTFITEKAYAATSYDELEEIMAELTGNDDLFVVTSGAGKTDLFINGAPAAATALVAADKSGTVYELFCEDDANGNKVTDVVVVDYAVGTITKVSTAVTKAQKEDGATCKVSVKTGNTTTVVLDNEFAGFDAETYVKDAVILYAMDASESGNVVLASEVAESVKGEITAKKSNSTKLAIDGVWYDNVTGETPAHGTKGTFYLNKAGDICKIDASVEKSENYAYIYKVAKDTGLNDDGISGDTYTAYMVLADGTKASKVIDADETTLCVESYVGVVAYSINADGELETEVAKDYIVDDFNVAISKNAVTFGVAVLDEGTNEGIRADGSTEFVFTYAENGKQKVQTATGYKNVSITSASTSWVVCDKDGYALYVFVDTANGAVASDKLYAVVLDEVCVDDVNADENDIYTFSVAIGEDNDATLTVETTKTNIDGVAAGQVFGYKMDGEYVDDSTVQALSSTTVKAINDDYVIFTTGNVRKDIADATIYTITMEYDDEADFNNNIIDNVSVTEGGTLEVSDVVYYILNTDGDLVTVYVVEYVY